MIIKEHPGSIRGTSSGDVPEAWSRERRPARGLITRSRAASGTALRALRPGREELADGRSRRELTSDRRKRGRGCIMPRWSAGRRAPYVTGCETPRQVSLACRRYRHAPVRRPAPAPLGASSPRARGTRKEAPPGALYSRKAGRPGGEALA